MNIKSTKLNLRIKTSFFILFTLLFFNINSQYSISGKIVDENKNSLAWATVSLSTSNVANYASDALDYASVTDLEGNYKFNDLKPNTYLLVVKYLGYHKVVKQIVVKHENISEFFNLKRKDFLVDEVIIQGAKIDESVPTTLTNVSKKEIEKNNIGQDIPYLLSQTPSMVVSSDAGAGIGYTYMRIRGSDASRINVTINGIPFNDAESHGTYFVNMPDLTSSLESVQIQRGAGTSTNGAGAFGASINLFTNFRNEKPYFEVSNSIGSFRTMKNTFKFGTGIIKKHFSFDGRLSNIVSDGYIDRSSSDLKSYFFSGQYVNGKNSLKFVTFAGKEITDQAWGGIPEDSLKTNRTYNPYTYENEIDNYTQSHYQLFFNREISNKLMLNTAFHYTKGKGYYEQYKEGKKLSDYGMEPIYLTNDTILESDLITRKWLDNDYYGMIFSLVYNPNSKFKTTFGGGINQYDGDHYGEVIWEKNLGDFNERVNRYYLDAKIRFYDNNGLKTDANLYSKTSYSFSNKLHSFIDLQVRKIDYSFLGYDENLANVQQSADYLFFNPKIGFSYNLNTSSKFYTLFAVANKEPNRDDLTESSPTSRPMHETLYDFELGFKKSHKLFGLSVNGYFMKYDNQLVATGELNDVGSPVRVNIKDSYRAGIEIEGGVKITKGLSWNANISFSENKIKDMTVYIDNKDTWEKDTIEYKESTLLFSPSVVASSVIEFKPFKQFFDKSKSTGLGDLSLSFISKYVGKQFIDNTESNERSLDAYFVHNLRINYSIKTKLIREISFFGSVNNVFNHLYSANAWVWRYSKGGVQGQDIGYYPQAGTNFMVGMNLKF